MPLWRTVSAEVSLTVDASTGYGLLREACSSVGRITASDAGTLTVHARTRYGLNPVTIDARVAPTAAPDGSVVHFDVRAQDATGQAAAKVIEKLTAAIPLRQSTSTSDASPPPSPAVSMPVFRASPLRLRSPAVLAALVLAVALPVVGVGVYAASHHRTAGCTGALSRLAAQGAGATVARYEHDLVTSCPDYPTFLADYNADSKLVYSPSTALVFCAAPQADQTPPDDYNSSLCTEARAVGGAGIN